MERGGFEPPRPALTWVERDGTIGCRPWQGTWRGWTAGQSGDGWQGEARFSAPSDQPVLVCRLWVELPFDAPQVAILSRRRDKWLGWIQQQCPGMLPLPAVGDPAFQRRYLTFGEDEAWLRAVLVEEARQALLRLPVACVHTGSRRVQFALPLFRRFKTRWPELVCRPVDQMTGARGGLLSVWHYRHASDLLLLNGERIFEALLALAEQMDRVHCSRPGARL